MEEKTKSFVTLKNEYYKIVECNEEPLKKMELLLNLEADILRAANLIKASGWNYTQLRSMVNLTINDLGLTEEQIKVFHKKSEENFITINNPHLQNGK